MQIRGFSTYIAQAKNILEDYTLEKCNVVIDAQNFFYNLYKSSNCLLLTGGEYDEYAKYIKEILRYFQRNDLRCYFIFKGGHSEKLDVRMKKFDEQVRDAISINDNIRDAILTRNVATQVLDELGIKYAVSMYEAKRDIVDLAIALRGIIISFDIEYCFYPVDYIPYTTIEFKENKLQCKIYRLQRFLKQYHIFKNSLAIFGTILDANNFPEGHFNRKLPQLRNIHPKLTIKVVLSNLRSNTNMFRQSILDRIDDEEKRKFIKIENSILMCLNYTGSGNFIVEYVLKGKLEFDESDLWFAKGVCSGRIAIRYVDLVKNKILLGSSVAEDKDLDDSLALSLKIIRYAYDLLTGYDGTTFTFKYRQGTGTTSQEITSALSIKKPSMVTEHLFRNGWTDFTPLFDAFLESILIDPTVLQEIPKNARILIVTLVYLRREGKGEASLAYSVLLCYVLLSSISVCKSKHLSKTGDSGDREAIGGVPTESENDMAAAAVAKYFLISGLPLRTAPKLLAFSRNAREQLSAKDKIFRHELDRKTVHMIIQFQSCLANMNDLDTLCATEHPPTVYHNAINGTFIYNMVKQLNKEEFPISFLENLLSDAPTVLASFLELVNFYDELVVSAFVSESK